MLPGESSGVTEDEATHQPPCGSIWPHSSFPSARSRGGWLASAGTFPVLGRKASGPLMCHWFPSVLVGQVGHFPAPATKAHPWRSCSDRLQCGTLRSLQGSACDVLVGSQPAKPCGSAPALFLVLFQSLGCHLCCWEKVEVKTEAGQGRAPGCPVMMVGVSFGEGLLFPDRH